ncbi:MAG: phosphodiesterase [Clostridium sp.]|uniref:phosphodiesterase n=1 Tax=Clostridium sp. TaxID=1506 RepID=UPI002FC8C090
MKSIFISDIHGSLKYAKKAMDIFDREKGVNLIILGDILYHGPRNPLPEEYNPQEVANLLNIYSDKIIAVRGNCDSEVDQMLLDFHCMGDYAIVLKDNKKLFLTHGHIFNEDNMPNLCAGDIVVHGHTHIPMSKFKHGIKIINPGSISYPKDGNPHTYGVLENESFIIKNIDGEIVKEISII